MLCNVKRRSQMLTATTFSGKQASVVVQPCGPFYS